MTPFTPPRHAGHRRSSGSPSTPTWSVFDELAARYDAWYDSPRGRALFEVEVDCLRPLLDVTGQPRLEVGVGSGRFAEALSIGFGLDPAWTPLELATCRSVNVVGGLGERLPFADDQFAAVVAVVTLCFADDPRAVLDEARRVLRRDGRLVLGVVPAESAWGRDYAELGRSGHPFYRGARFSSLREHLDLLEGSGWHVLGVRSALVRGPGDPDVDRTVYDRVVDGAGFVAIAAAPTPDRRNSY